MDAVSPCGPHFRHRLRPHRRERTPEEIRANAEGAAAPTSGKKRTEGGMTALLEVAGVTAFYGTSQALFGVDLAVGEGGSGGADGS